MHGCPLKTKSGIWMALLGLLAAGLAGCGVFDRPELTRSNFGLSVEAPRRSAAPDAPTLGVRYFEAAPRFENDQFVYRLANDVWETDFYHVFSGAPAALITSETRRWLDRSGLFREAGIPGLAPRGSWHLEGYIEELYGDFRDPAAPTAVLAIRFALRVPGTGAAANPVWENTLSARTPLEQRTAQGLAQAWNRSLTSILRQLDAGLRPVLARQAAAGE